VFIREYQIICNGVEISSIGKLTPLKVTFSCSATITSQQDKFSVSIWNLSEATRKALENEGSCIEVYAGYRDSSFGLIAKGEVRTVISQRDIVDIVTTITAGSGDKACQKGTCNKTLNKGCSVKEAITACTQEMENVTVGQIMGCDQTEDNTHRTLCGSARKNLNKLAKKNGFDWWIEKQELCALRKDLMFGQSTICNVYNGMIGSPKLNQDGVTVEMLLNPDVRIGTQLIVQSKDINRTYKIVSYNHSGDFLGGSASWKTTITGKMPDKLSTCGGVG